MKLDPGIHIVMHSVLCLKPGVTYGGSDDLEKHRFQQAGYLVINKSELIVNLGLQSWVRMIWCLVWSRSTSYPIRSTMLALLGQVGILIRYCEVPFYFGMDPTYFDDWHLFLGTSMSQTSISAWWTILICFNHCKISPTINVIHTLLIHMTRSSYIAFLSLSVHIANENYRDPIPTRCRIILD